VAIETPSQYARTVFDWLATRPEGFTHCAYLTVDCLKPQSAPAIYDEHHAELVGSLGDSGGTVRFLSFILAIATWKEYSRLDEEIEDGVCEMIWSSLREFLMHSEQDGFTVPIVRSAQGFLSLPLCSVISNGRIVELFRLHIWLADGQRGSTEFAIHAHQSFAVSWIIAGFGTNHTYEVRNAGDSHSATHAEYIPIWSDGGSPDRAYKTVQKRSTLLKTEKMVHATKVQSETHTRNTRYSVPAGAFHSSDIPGDAVHATLFFFDSHRGFAFDAGVLGPKNAKEYTVTRDPGNVSVLELVRMVEILRRSDHPSEKSAPIACSRSQDSVVGHS
jgi:hypothetical protein